LGYAVIEGVTFGLADGLNVLGNASICQCSLTGGGARSPLWAQLIADVLNIPMVTHPASSSGALGAARLAWLADGGDEAKVCLKPRWSPVLRRSLNAANGWRNGWRCSAALSAATGRRTLLP
jgi:sugar (pentulose or hexulose) kinase